MVPERKKSSAQPWHAVEIVCSGSACESAIALAGRRFLSDQEPPRLPLADCPHAEKCSCRYRHFKDRRTASRRDSNLDATGKLRTLASNRREGRGRRDED
jgi:hypothetical protein